ncbi:MAG: tyrosine-type recombinase/integrase [Bdellovibrionales bacterium]
MVRLTKTHVEGLKPGEPDYFVWDETLPGFGVRVWPSGKKTYIAQYRAVGRTRRIKIGNHGVLTVEEARKQAKGILGDVARGEDPQEDRLTRRKAMTVSELCEAYLYAAERGLIMGKGGRAKRESTLAIDKGRIERHIKPLLGTKLVRELTPSDIGRFIRDVASGKTAGVVKTDLVRGQAIVKGGAGTASRCAAFLGGMLSFAVAEGVIAHNPARGVKRPAYGKRTRRLNAEEYCRLGEALRVLEREGESLQAIKAAWLLALTGCRLNEIVELKWAEVDDVGRCLRLEDSKEGASVRPLGAHAMEILRSVGRKDDALFVLEAVRGKGSFGGMPRAWRRFAKRAGFEDVTPHTLRHSFASVSGDLGFADSTIAALLGHSTGSMTSRYVHKLDAVLIAAADKVAEAVWGMMEDGKNNG